MIGEVLTFILFHEGYNPIKEIENRGICGIEGGIFTADLVYGIDDTESDSRSDNLNYIGRYCFHCLVEASDALKTWDGKGDPAGNWIKHKGITEYCNPHYKE